MIFNWIEILEIDEDENYKNLSLSDEVVGDKNGLHFFCILDRNMNQVEFNLNGLEYEIDDDLMEYFVY